MTVNYKSTKQSIFASLLPHPLLKKTPYFSLNIKFVQSICAGITLQKKKQSYQNSSKDEATLNMIIKFTQHNHLQQKLTKQNIDNSLLFQQAIENQVHFTFDQVLQQPLFIFLMIFASEICVPSEIIYKTKISEMLFEIGLSTRWQKNNKFYKATIVQMSQLISQKPVISHEDILAIHKCISQLSSKQLNNQFMNYINLIKKMNAFNSCIYFFKDSLKSGLLQMQEHKIIEQFQRILSLIQSIYNKLSCSQLLLTIKKFQQQNRKSIHNLKNCKKVKNNIQKCIHQYSIKKLKSKIRELLTQSSTKVNNQSLQAYMEQQCQEYVQQTIKDLFQTQYQLVKQRISQQCDKHKPSFVYRAVLQKMRMHMEIDYKCMFLFQIMLNHALQSKSIQKQNNNKKPRLYTYGQQRLSQNDQLLLSPSTILNQTSIIQSQLLDQNSRVSAYDDKKQQKQMKIVEQNMKNAQTKIENMNKRKQLNIIDNFNTIKNNEQSSEQFLLSSSRIVKKSTTQQQNTRLSLKQNNKQYISTKIEQMKNQPLMNQYMNTSLKEVRQITKKYTKPQKQQTINKSNKNGQKMIAIQQSKQNKPQKQRSYLAQVTQDKNRWRSNHNPNKSISRSGSKSSKQLWKI